MWHTSFRTESIKINVRFLFTSILDINAIIWKTYNKVTDRTKLWRKTFHIYTTFSTNKYLYVVLKLGMFHMTLKIGLKIVVCVYIFLWKQWIDKFFKIVLKSKNVDVLRVHLRMVLIIIEFMALLLRR